MAFPLILLPLLTLPYSLYVFWTTSHPLPRHPSHSCYICRFLNHHSFSSLISELIHSSFLSAVFVISARGAPRCLKCPKQCTEFTPFTPLFSAIVPHGAINFMSTCVSFYIHYVMCHLIRPHPAACLAAIPFYRASVCVLTGDYILPLSSDKTVQSSSSHEMVCSVLGEAGPHTVMIFFFAPSEKGKPITR